MLLTPHNGHWTLVHSALYEALFVTVGLRSYLPYLALMVAAHAACVVLLFLLVRRRGGDLLAVGASAILLVYGPAAEDLAWAFQVGFVAAVAFGLGALLLIDEPKAGRARVGVAAMLLTFAVATSGMGLVMCILVGAEVALDPARRRFLVALVPPAVVYAPWYLLIARGSAAVPNLSTTSVLTLPDFVRHGLAPATAAVFGLPNFHSTVVVLIVGAVVGASWLMRGQIGSRAAGPLIALVSEFVLIGLTRGQLGINQGAGSRYLYVAAVLILLVLADAFKEFPARWPVVAPLTGLVLISMWFNSHQLVSFAVYRTGFASVQTAELETFEAYRGDPDITPDAVIDPLIAPISPREYYDATTAWGSPVGPASPETIAHLDAGAVDRGLVTLFANGLAPGPAPTPMPACGGTELVASPGSVVIVIPGAGNQAVVSVAMFATDDAAPSVVLDVPVTLTLGGDHLSRAWRVTVSGGSVCPLG